MTPHATLSLALLALLALAPFAATAASDGVSVWPPKLTTAAGTEFAATGNVAYDGNTSDGDDFDRGATRLDDAHGWRRREFGVSLKRKGVYEAGVAFDFEAKTWMDVSLRLDSQAFLGRDAGRVRVGQMKLPLGFEGNTATRNASFMENSLATQAFYQGRRIGLDWAFERRHYLVNAGYYGQDLQGNNPGNTLAARAAWTPRKATGDVLHLGVSATRERLRGETNGLGVEVPPSVRWRAKPEASLAPLRLVDSGALAGVGDIHRSGVEALWIRGPVSLQGEYLRQTSERNGTLGDYSTDGYYLFASWLVTGGSRSYSGGNVSNPGPGSVELLLRHSHIDLDSDGIAGGRERNWTAGANWYPWRHLKLQANVVFVDATRGPRTTRGHVGELRAQFSF
ncbi:MULTISPECIES: OprO/OprP family phosphate-selective porin [Luteimonas]|uniref:OprO/OprP family phosphate-selective porin n=1 Tax=Luteimonas TaxID=83614 RepID=UPI000C7BD28E|nr:MULTISPECIES: porin [Luteimonas]